MAAELLSAEELDFNVQVLTEHLVGLREMQEFYLMGDSSIGHGENEAQLDRYNQGVQKTEGNLAAFQTALNADPFDYLWFPITLKNQFSLQYL